MRQAIRYALCGLLRGHVWAEWTLKRVGGYQADLVILEVHKQCIRCGG